ncbi:MAG: thioredoxin [Hymenobacter sp.]|nr:MAG: thioredoxin [Hymenobacter sp.]
MRTLIKFHASWCKPCQNMVPTMDKIKEEFDGELKFVDIDIDDNPQTRLDYNIRSIPAFVLVEDGAEIDRKIGSLTYSELEEWLD